MPDVSDRTIAALLGIAGAVLLILEGAIDLLRGVVYLAIGRGTHAIGPFDASVVLVVIGLLVGLFAILGRIRSGSRSLVSGVVLIVVAIIGWLALGFGSGIVSLLGTIFVLLSGVVFLVSAR